MPLQQLLIDALQQSLSWPTIGWIILGTLYGIFVGVLPGEGSSIGMAIVLPLTLAMQPINAILFLIVIYSGAMYGGSVASILINVPGTAGAAATTFDGHSMALQGKAMNALSISAVSSWIGGMIASVVIILSIPLLVEVVLLFGTTEYFLMTVLGIALISVVSQGSVAKGMFSGMFGLLLTTIGIAPMTPTLRYTFDSLALRPGVSYIAALIGMFAIAEMIDASSRTGGLVPEGIELVGNRFQGFRDVFKRPILVLKSTVIGFIVGAFPGSGSSVSNFVAYAEAVRSYADDTFGEGNIKGVIAPEASNSGTVPGSLIPTLTFGIPGSGSTAVLLGALILHGVRPGPALFLERVDFVYTVLVGEMISNFIVIFIGIAFITQAHYVTKIDTNILVPVIVVFSVMGAFLLNNNYFDVWVALFFGVLGYFFKKYDYSVIAFVLGIVLGGIAEENLFRALQLSGGSLTVFVDNPISAILVLIIVLILIGPYIQVLISKIRGEVT